MNTESNTNTVDVTSTRIHRPMRNPLISDYLINSQKIEKLEKLPRMIRDTAAHPTLQTALIDLVDEMVDPKGTAQSIDFRKGVAMLELVRAAKKDGLEIDTDTQVIATTPEAGVARFEAPRYFDGYVQAKLARNRKHWRAEGEYGRFALLRGDRKRVEQTFRALIAFKMMTEGMMK